jgi:hypothetical protein
MGRVLLAVLCWSVFLTALWLIKADPHRGGSISLMPGELFDNAFREYGIFTQLLMAGVE